MCGRFLRRYFKDLYKRSSTTVLAGSYETKKRNFDDYINFLYFGTENGYIYCCDLKIMLDKLKLSKHMPKPKLYDGFTKINSNINPIFKSKKHMIESCIRQQKLYEAQNYRSDILNPKIEMSDEIFPFFCWKVFDTPIQELKIIKIPKEYIITGAENKHIISIYSLLGRMH